MSNTIGRWFSHLSRTDLEQVLDRFYLSVLQVALLVTLLCCGVENYELLNVKWWQVAIYYLSSGAILSWGLQMFAERHGSKGKLLLILAQLLWLGNAAYLYFSVEIGFSSAIANVALLGCIVIFSLIAPTMGTKTETPTWNYVLKTLATIAISAIIAIFLAGGLSLLLLTLNLLFSFGVAEYVYGHLWMSVPIPVFTYLFLSQQPRSHELIDEELRPLPILNIFARYLLAPLLGIYLVLLYIYALRILQLWELPNGWVSYPISALLAGLVLLVALLYPARQEGQYRSYDEFLCRWLPLLVIPLLVLMSVGLARRWSDYGITVMRLYLLAFNVWSYFVCIYLYWHRSQRLRLLPVSASLLFVLCSVGPLSFPNITRSYMRYELNKILAEAKQKPKLPMTQQRFESFVQSLSPQRRQQFVSQLEYLESTYSHKSIQDIIDEAVWTYSVADPEPITPTENWSLEQPEDFIALPEGFKTFWEKDLYVEWSKAELSEDTLIHNDNTGSPNIIASLNEIQEWTLAKPYRSHLFRTTEANIFYYASSANLHITRNEKGQTTQMSGTITGMYVRK